MSGLDLTAKCVQCHDLRTVLARPRTPKSWRQTVSRMANRSTILNPITEDDQWFVTAVQNVTDQEIAAIADYLSGQK